LTPSRWFQQTALALTRGHMMATETKRLEVKPLHRSAILPNRQAIVFLTR
jgi:hypothetical protein